MKIPFFFHVFEMAGEDSIPYYQHLATYQRKFRMEEYVEKMMIDAFVFVSVDEDPPSVFGGKNALTYIPLSGWAFRWIPKLEVKEKSLGAFYKGDSR